MPRKVLFPALQKNEVLDSSTNDEVVKPIELKDIEIKQFFEGIEIDPNTIKLLNTMTYDDICTLKVLFEKKTYKNVGRKKKQLPISVEEIYKQHQNGTSYIDIAQQFGMSYKTLRQLINDYEKTL